MPPTRLLARPGLLLTISRPSTCLRSSASRCLLLSGSRFLSHTRPRSNQRPPPQRRDPSSSSSPKYDPYEHLRHARPLVPDRVATRFQNAGSGRNSRLFVVATVLTAVAFYLYNSQTVPVTGRRRFNFLSDAMVARAHAKAGAEIIEQVKQQGGHFLSDWDPRTIRVKRVMKRLIPVSGMSDLDWEIFVIADNRTLHWP